MRMRFAGCDVVSFQYSDASDAIDVGIHAYIFPDSGDTEVYVNGC